VKTLITADWHLDENPINEYRWKFLSWLSDYVDNNNIERIVFLGDLTERKDRHSSKLVNKIFDYFVELTKKCYIVFVKGNHDFSTEIPFFSFIGRLNNVMFVNNFVNRNGFKSGLEELFIGYMNEQGWEENKDVIMNLVKNPEKTIVFTHQHLKGLFINNADTGGDIDLKFFKNFKYVFSGHIHQNMEIENFIYVGSPYQVDFGDENNGFIYILDGDNLEKIKYETISKLSIVLNDVSEVENYKIKKDDLVKVKLYTNRTDLSKINELRKEIKSHIDKNGGKLVSFDFVSDNKPIQIETIKNETDEEIITKFCKNNNLSDEFLRIAFDMLNEYRGDLYGN